MTGDTWSRALAAWLHDDYYPWLVKLTAAVNQLEQQVADLSGLESDDEGDPVPPPPPPPPFGET
jgi:hypothetical protein